MDSDEEEALAASNLDTSLQSGGNLETTDTAVKSPRENTQAECGTESVVELERSHSQSSKQLAVEEEEQIVSKGNLVGREEERGVLDGGDGVVAVDWQENGVVEEDGKVSGFLKKTDEADVIEEMMAGEGTEAADKRTEGRERAAALVVDGGGTEETDVVAEMTEQMQTEFFKEKGETRTDDQRGTEHQLEFVNVDEEKKVLEVKEVPVVSVENGILETDLMREGEETLGTEVTEVEDGTEMGEDVGKNEDSEMTKAVDEDEKEEESETEEVDGAEDNEMANLTEVAEESEEVSKSIGGKRKRGKNSKAVGRAPSRRKAGEDVCFICFDGGDLVLCDRRGCPKTYHPSCVGRDEAFFRSKGQWNCGVHLCSNCQKNAHYMCYTCTSSLCKGCIKDSVFFPMRGSKGFCESCRNLILLIERIQQGNEEKPQIDFDDKNSWEYLFKDYWIDLKRRLSLTSDEVAKAENFCKGSESNTSKQQLPHEESGFEGSNAEVTVSKRRKTRGQSKSHSKDGDSPSTITAAGAEGASTGGSGNGKWASKELLDVVMHMRNGDKSVLPRIELNQLIVDYIKKHELRDRRNKSYVMCDFRLKNLFGKPRVGHIEMLNLLDLHVYFTKEDSHMDDLQGTITDGESKQLDADTVKAGKDKKRKSRKKGTKGRQSNLDDYAAIDMHNINLIYLRRNLVEELLDDTESFLEIVVGAFVRIRISGAGQKQDLYRLVQVTGTSKVPEPYKVGKRTTDFFLEILNLNKTEVISIDIISNQEFTEDECKRLRQSIKCGLIGPLTVGDILEKAMALQAVRVNDWIESEIVRLIHLRDRASDTGRRKELRECVEKLQLLKTPEERQRRLDDIPEIHSDPNMDPNHESEEDEDETDDKRNDNNTKPRASSFGRKWEAVSPRKGGFASSDSWSGTRNLPSTNRELTRSLSSKDDSTRAVATGNENLWILGRHRETQPPKSWDDKPTTPTKVETSARNAHNIVMPELSSKIVPVVAPVPSSGVTNTSQINETEKMWHYKDPSGKVQGPFSMAQLRKWNKNGYFPADLRIWKKTETVDNSILLTDALAGKFQTHSQNAWRPETTLLSPTPNLTANGGTRGQVMESRPSPKSIQPSGSLPVANAGASLQNLAQPANSHNSVETHRWGSGSMPGPEMVASSAVPAAAEGSAVNFATSGQIGLPASDYWRPPVQGQSNVQPLPWGMDLTNNQNAALGPVPGNQNPGWGPMPGNSNMGWVAAPVPMNTNPGWAAAPLQPQMATNTNSGWVVPGNPMPAWIQPGQAPPVVNANSGWIAPPAQGALQGNANTGWAPPQNPNGGSKPYNRQRSFGNGGDSSRPPKGQVECPYYKTGRCRRGAQCDYLHT